MFYSCITYWDDLYVSLWKLTNDYGIKCIGIIHDKDKDKKTHNHIILSIDTASIEEVKQILKKVGDGNVLVQVVQDIQKSIDYLTHKKSRGKYKYDESEKLSLDLAYWLDVYTIGDTESLDLVDDLLSDNFDAVLMARKYGRDFIKNFSHYLNFRNYVRSNNND